MWTKVQPPSVDRVRLIRRGMRCFVFGSIGLIPILGSGLAIQAIRLRDDIKAELGERPDLPPVYVYWLGGLILLWALDGRWGISGDLATCVVLLAAQTGAAALTASRAESHSAVQHSARAMGSVSLSREPRTVASERGSSRTLA